MRRGRALRLVLLEICDDPSVVLDDKLLAARLQVTPRMARNYRRWLLEEGYIVVVWDAKGRRAALTDKARGVLEHYYRKLAKALGGGEELANLLKELFK